MTDFSLDKLTVAMTEAEGHGVVFPEALKGALHEAADPHYKIGVMGRFQVGKTTLVNRVFLRKPLLKEGEGLCTTAVCTEVTYGPEQKMTLVKDGVKQTFSPPTTEAIVAATTAGTEEARLALAESITQLRIETPNENLRRYTILDTPGLDDPNRALLDVTTYRELPQCDLVLLVADARQLSQIDFSFLRGTVFSAGLTQAMVLLSYNPNANYMDAEMRQNVLDTVRAGLASRGLEHIPVQMVCYDGEAPDILDTPEKVEAAVLDYLSRTVGTARSERLRAQTAQVIVERAKSRRLLGELAKKKRAEVEVLNAQREQEEIKQEERLGLIQGQLSRDLRETAGKLGGMVDQVCAALRQELSGNVADLTERVLSTRLDALCGDVLGQAQADCREVAQRHLAEVAELIEGMDDFLGIAAEEAKDSVDTAPHASSPIKNIFNSDIWEFLREKMGGDPLDKVIDWGSDALASRLEHSKNPWIRLAGQAVRYLPTFLKPLRGKLAAQALDEQLATFGGQLRTQVETLVDGFHEWLDAAIDARVEQAREQLKRTFAEALDNQPDDPVALAAEAETLEALAKRILA